MKPGNRIKHPNRSAEHKAEFLGPYKGKKKTEKEREAERPEWMSDPSLLPKRPPGR